MPAPPKILRVAGKIGKVEVEHELKTHQFRNTPRDVRVAGKIAVNLHGEGNRCGDHFKPARGGQIIDMIHERGKVVCDENLFKIPAKDQVDAVGPFFPGDRPWGIDLSKQVACALNRPGYKMGEVKHRQEKIPEALRRMGLPAVHVDGVGKRLEGVERNSDRQDHLERRQGDIDAHQRPGLLNIFRKKIKIFEKSKQPKVGYQADDKIGPPVYLRLALANQLFQPSRNPVVNCCGK